jgi:thioredoxin reductase (NADPH)
MQLMEKQAKRFGAEILVGTVDKVSKSSLLTINYGKESVTSDVVILATGATAKLLGLPAEKELMGYGVSTCATCDGAFYRGKTIAVVGGGDSACEEAMFLTRFGSVVYLIHRRDKLRASKIMQDRALANPKIKPIWNSGISNIFGDRKSGVTAIELEDTVNGKKTKLDLDGLFIAIGHTPNSALVKDFVALDENGYIVPKPNSTATNTAGLFACGDVQDHVWRQAITAAGSGCMAAMEAERYLESLKK